MTTENNSIKYLRIKNINNSASKDIIKNYLDKLIQQQKSGLCDNFLNKLQMQCTN